MPEYKEKEKKKRIIVHMSAKKWERLFGNERKMKKMRGGVGPKTAWGRDFTCIAFSFEV